MIYSCLSIEEVKDGFVYFENKDDYDRIEKETVPIGMPGKVMLYYPSDNIKTGKIILFGYLEEQLIDSIKRNTFLLEKLQKLKKSEI
jgi:hypothetical protein